MILDEPPYAPVARTQEVGKRIAAPTQCVASGAGGSVDEFVVAGSYRITQVQQPVADKLMNLKMCQQGRPHGPEPDLDFRPDPSKNRYFQIAECEVLIPRLLKSIECS